MMVPDQTARGSSIIISNTTTRSKSSSATTNTTTTGKQNHQQEMTNMDKKVLHPQHEGNKDDEKEDENEMYYDDDDDAPMNQGLLSRKRKRIWKRLIEQQSLNVNEWMRPYWLGFGLFLLLFAFWLLDSLKDPMFAKLTQGNLDKHQPPAKLFSVLCTLFLVCCMEYLANIRNQKQQQQQQQSHPHQHVNNNNKSTTSTSTSTIKTHTEVLDPGGDWNRMTILEEYKSTKTSKAPDDTVSISIFFQIGIPYSIAFIIIAYFLSKFQQQQQNEEQLKEENHDNQNEDDWNTCWYVLAYGIYATIESFGSISVATFWSYTNSTLSLNDAEKYYGPIIAIAQIGAIGGSTMVATDHWSSPTLLIVVSLIIILQLMLMWIYHHKFPPTSELLSTTTTTQTPLAAAGRNKNKYDVVDHNITTAAGSGSNSSRRRQQQQQQQFLLDDNATILTWQDDNVTVTKPFWSGLYLIFQHYYVILILGVSCLYEISLTCLDYQMKLLGLEKYDRDDGDNNDFPNQTATDEGVLESNHHHSHNNNRGSNEENIMTFSQFMGHYGQTVNMISLVFSLILFPILIRRCGLRITLRLFPTLLLGVTVIAYIALPGNLTVLFVSLSLLKAMTYSVHDPSKEILYIPTSNAVKFRAKFWIDIVGERISKAIGSGFNTLAGNVERSVKLGGIPSLISSAALWIVCYYAGMEFDRLIKTGEIVGLDSSSMIDPSTYHRVDGGGGGRDVNVNDDDDDDLSSKPSEVEIEFHNDDSVSAFADVELDIQHDTSPLISSASNRTPSIIEMTTTTETKKNENR